MNETQNYWDSRYAQGLGSGEGSRGDLLLYKADFLNDVFATYGVRSVFDVGCGDGFLAQLLKCHVYYGIDVSEESVKECRRKVVRPGFHFEHIGFPSGVVRDVDAVICIDVLYHIMADALVEKTLETIFGMQAPTVVLYTIPNERMNNTKVGAIYFKDTTEILKRVAAGYDLVETKEPKGISAAAFYVYRRRV